MIPKTISSRIIVKTIYNKPQILRNFSSNYNTIDFNNTQNAYQLLDNQDLIQQKYIYKMCNTLSGNENIGHKLINGFMNIKPPFIYPKIQDMLFIQFCGGETLQEITPIINNLNKQNIAPLLNYGVEYTTSTQELDNSRDEKFNMIDYLHTNQSGQAIYRATGLMSYERLAKKQAQIDLSQEEEDEWKLDIQRMEDICEYAVEKKVPLLFDAETLEIQTEINKQAIRIMRELNTGPKPYIYTTIQFYRKDSHKQLEQLLEDTQINNYIAGLKLVRGAYIYDEILADRRHLLHDSKEETNISYNTGLTKCIQNIDKLAICVASHNIDTVKHTIELLEEYNIPPYTHHIIMAQMYGMRKDITFNLDNVNVSQFIPYGKKSVLFPYLVRRGIENSSALGGVKTELELVNKEIKRRRHLN